MRERDRLVIKNKRRAIGLTLRFCLKNKRVRSTTSPPSLDAFVPMSVKSHQGFACGAADFNDFSVGFDEFRCDRLPVEVAGAQVFGVFKSFFICGARDDGVSGTTHADSSVLLVFHFFVQSPFFVNFKQFCDIICVLYVVG